MPKRVLITGGAGFIGHHVVGYLLEKTDWDLIVLDRLDSSGNPNRLTDLPNFDGKRVKFVWWDLKSALNNSVAAQIGLVDDIIHLAASSHVDRSISDPASFIADNVLGTTNLLQWAEQSGMKQVIDEVDSANMLRPTKKHWAGKFINFSTDEVFGPAAEGYAHKENDPHKPSNPYSASKSGQEAIGFAFYITYNLPVVTTHTMNNFGERQHPEKLVPKAIRSNITDQAMPVFAELNDKNELQAVGSRYWIHCRNTASAILFLLANGIGGETYNIIGFDELTNEDIVKKVGTILGKEPIISYVDYHKTRPGHDMRYALDGSKMRDMGWVPELSFEESLRQTVEFTRDNPQWQ